MNQSQRDKLLTELFQHATESIIAVDEKGCIMLVNPATEKLFGYSLKELTGKKVECLLPDRIATTHTNHRRHYSENPHARAMGIGMDLYAKKKDGSEFPVEISLSPFEYDKEKFTIAFIIDITRRKAVEQQVVAHQQKLEQMTHELKGINEKLESKVIDRTKVLQEALAEIEKSRGELSEALEKEKELNELKSRFLSMASHEFRTPLTTILSSASLIPEYPLTEQQHKRERHVERIKSAVNNLNDILSDFLSLSRIEEGKINAELKSFVVGELVNEVVNEIKGIAKSGQEIVQWYNGTDHIKSDRKLIKNILINLLSNAIKFSPENKPIELRIFLNEQQICFEIEDHGMGISKEDQAHLFERFFRGQNAMNIQGTGLGLNIVSRYVELLNGKIELKSELEQGTTFFITIPISN